MAISERIQENPLYLLFWVPSFWLCGLRSSPERDLFESNYWKLAFSSHLLSTWIQLFFLHQKSLPRCFSSLHASCMFPFRYLLICLFVFSSSFWWGDVSNQKALKMGFVWFNRVRVLFEVNFCIYTLFHKAYRERNSNIVIISFWNKFDESVIWQDYYGP